MLNTQRSSRGMVTTPHHLASQSGLDQLKAGGSAVEAVVAAAATLSVVYGHMTGLGGDGFWLISEPGQPEVGICAAGRTGAAVGLDLYRNSGLREIPTRGPLAANTVAGAVDGWRAALEIGAGWSRRADLASLFADAIHYAENGSSVTRSQAKLTSDGFTELAAIPGFAEAFLYQGRPPVEGERLANPALARTFRRLADEGLDSFYRGPLAEDIAADFARLGSPLTGEDLARHHYLPVQPMSVLFGPARVFNLPPPSQGVISLMILSILDRIGLRDGGFDHIHCAVEATKLAFVERDRHIGDPSRMTIDPAGLLDPKAISHSAASIDRREAKPWATSQGAGDTVWLGAIDAQGRAVSYIQSIYFDFGSGLVLPNTGILWQNRGISFSLDEGHPRSLRPATLPFHTLCPAFARFADGRRMVFGAMGGDGQPQSHAAIFPRYALFNQSVQEAITAPRWLLGRRWGDDGTTLKLEDRFSPELVAALRAAGHDIEILPPFDDLMGHAGAIVQHVDGRLEGASDPRSDGSVAAW